MGEPQYRNADANIELRIEDLAIARVQSRVLQGGHAIPPETIRRRFHAGIENFNVRYKPLVDAWTLYDNSGPTPILIEEVER